MHLQRAAVKAYATGQENIQNTETSESVCLISVVKLTKPRMSYEQRQAVITTEPHYVPHYLPTSSHNTICPKNPTET